MAACVAVGLALFLLWRHRANFAGLLNLDTSYRARAVEREKE